jgi:putative endopeptidase
MSRLPDDTVLVMGLRNALTMFVIAACSAKAPAPSAPIPTPTAGSSSPGSGSSAPVAPPVEPPGVKVTLADVGLEASALDRTADPCVDFYQFSCGGWLARTPIPADRARWSKRAEMDDKNRQILRGLLDEAAKGISADPVAKKLGDFYASCMDETAVERAGLAAIKPQLDRIAKVKNPKSWQAALHDLHKVGQWVVFEPIVAPDPKDSTKYTVTLQPAGFGLPERDYYVKPEHADKLIAYGAHVAKLLGATGMAPAKLEAAAKQVVAIEVELAKLRKSAVEERDVAGMHNPIDPKALAKTVKSIDWKGYWKLHGATPGKTIGLTTPKYFQQLDKIRQRIKPAQWASYFTYHLVAGRAFTLGKALDTEAFELRRMLTGVEQPLERSRRCVDTTESALGELLGQQYAAKHFSAASKQAVTKLVETVALVMAEHLGKLDWMSEATRKMAQQKLAKVVTMVGYPEQPRSYELDVKREDFAGNVMRADAFETRRVLQRIGKPVARVEWYAKSFTVDAFYDATKNTATIPAGILQGPYYGADRSYAANLGGIGAMIGHELTHAFDDQGARYDGDGNLANWWQKEDETKFASRGSCVADQYSTFEALKGQFVNGRLTLGEDIADLGGAKFAFQAYRHLRKDAAKTYNADGFSEDQQFFIAHAQSWCSKARPAETQRRLATDTHSPPKFRIYGALRNMPEFAQAFSCAPGTPMRPANACSVW